MTKTEKGNKKNLSKEEAYAKACNFCAYQERTQQEVRQKLYNLGLYSDDVEELISKLIVENFLNEERFAKAFAGGKFRIKKWGRNKIVHELRARKLSEYCIKKGLAEIDGDDYIKVLEEQIEQKLHSNRESNFLKKKHKIAAYLIGRGFEADLVWQFLKAEE